MLEFNPQKLAALRTTLTDFQNRPLSEAGAGLLYSLGYKSDKTADFGSKPEQFISAVEEATHSTFNRDKAHVSRWKQCAFLFQFTNDEIPSLAMGQQAFSTDNKLARSLIESFVFLAIELQGESWSRTDLAAIARELNRRFPMPAIVIFRHGELLSLVVIDRRANLKDAAKDVIDSRITVIKDVRIANPHRAHLDILAGLALENLGGKRRPTNFRELYDAWIEALSTQTLNKRFYQELANWYFWALTQAQFPQDAPKDADGRDSLSLIRLITRIIFCWFLKEKGLLPDALFDPRKVATLLGDYNPTESTYYKAILQNLFFATLNQEMDKREFRKAGQNFMAHNLYRYRSLMNDPDEVRKLLAGIPFMNGGLFECLDKTLGTREKPTYVRIDGFSDRDDNPLKIPNELFFGEERVVDLSGAYGDNKFKSAKVTGLIHILDRYKFTVAENTPIEEEVALDPELLGKVFENLLAAYNPETGATARKQTGSFYTPREIVNYMVDESLIASLKSKLEASPVGRDSSRQELPDTVGMNPDLQKPHDIESRLRHLFAYHDQSHQFTAAEVEALIEAIDHLKILDPACGSGAFPMGVLHKLVFVLGKLDPGNRFWKARQLAKASEIEDTTVRERVMDDIEQTFGANELDYGRKLYLIENCIYGVDIQPIAVQISKLRFFISLVVEQKINLQADNRGIRPLPNLETKFVAANTLIGINRPGQQLLRNLDIDVKEAELRNVRERHFLARTPATKAKCREQDAMLRAEIAELLKSDGWNTAIACALAEWNPYDQNASADFFDLEWMFGMMKGFDAAIGNPPYGLVGSDQPEARKYYTSGRFKLTAYKPNLYLLFLERGLELLKTGCGMLSFIIPKSLVFNSFFEKPRRILLTNYSIPSIVELRDKVFEAAEVGDSVIFFGKVELPTETSLLEYKVVEQITHESEPLSIFRTPQNILAASSGALFRLSSLGTPKSQKALGDLWEVSNGLNPGNVRHILLSTSQLTQKHRKMVLGRDIQRFSIKWSGTWVNFDPELKHSITPSQTKSKKGMTAQARVDFALRSPEIYTSNKVLVRKTADHIVACLDYDGYCFDSLSFGIHPRSQQYQPEFLLGLLNSKYIGIIHSELAQNKDKVFAKVLAENLRKLPMPELDLRRDADRQKYDRLVSLVKQILESKADNAKADISTLDQQVDELVYELYGLSQKEISLVEEAASSRPSKQVTQEIESEP